VFWFKYDNGGDRYGQLKDPFGHLWSIATHKQDLSQEEIQKAGEIVLKDMMGITKERVRRAIKWLLPSYLS
jgi:hypothetical protein